MSSNKISVLLFIFLFLSPVFCQISQSTFYLSPGIGIMYDFKSNISVDLKISIGKMESERLYYNITFGKRININKTGLDKKIAKYYYSDFQMGYFGNFYPFSLGSGFGIIFYNYNKLRIYPKLNFFIGAGLFGNIDYIFFKNNFNFGFQTVLPLCSNSRYRKLSQ